MYFLTSGLKLNPIYHVRYWMGLTTTLAGSASRYVWTDNVTPAPVGSFYKNWGTEVSRCAEGGAGAAEVAYPAGQRPRPRPGGSNPAGAPCRAALLLEHRGSAQGAPPGRCGRALGPAAAALQRCPRQPLPAATN
jgi:hypothetical protein